MTAVLLYAEQPVPLVQWDAHSRNPDFRKTLESSCAGAMGRLLLRDGYIAVKTIMPEFVEGALDRLNVTVRGELGVLMPADREALSKQMRAARAEGVRDAAKHLRNLATGVVSTSRLDIDRYFADRLEEIAQGLDRHAGDVEKVST